MKYKFISKDATFSDNKKERAENVLTRLEKFCSKEPECTLTLSRVVDGVIKIDAKLIVGKESYIASVENESYSAALDKIYDKLKKQLRREKDKKIAKEKAVQ